MADKITIDIEILKGIFSDLNALKAQFGDVSKSVKAIEGITGQAFGSLDENVKGVNTGVGALKKNLDQARAIDIAAVASSFQAINQRLNETTESGIRFQSSMADLSAITGLAGKDLEDVGVNARNLTKELGGEASDSVNTYKLLLSQLSPELGKYPDLLNEMARNAILLGKTMGGDTAGATEVLTTVMNQFGVDLKNPKLASQEMTRIMNVMAAAAKEGSAELPALKAGMMNSGQAAKLAGLNYEQTAAALEVLDKAGLKGSEGGIALRNTLSILATGRFLPPDTQKELMRAGIDVNALGDKTKSLRERLELLKPVAGDTALMVKLFGRENAQGGQALIANTGLLQEYTDKITGTNTANEQAAVVMGTYSERMSRWKAQFSDFGITLFNITEKFQPFINIGFSSIGMIADLANAQKGLAMIMNTRLVSAVWNGIVALRSMSVAQMLSAGWAGIVAGATSLWTGAQWLLNAALDANPIGIVVVAIAALVGAVLYAWNHFEGFRAFLYGLWESIKVVFNGIKDVVMGVFGVLSDIVGGYAKVLMGAFTLDWGMIKEGLAQGARGAKSALDGLLDAPDKLKQAGLNAGLAYAEGDAKGRASFKADKAKDAAASTATPIGTTNAKAVAPGQDVGAAGLLGGAAPGVPAVAGVAAGGTGGGKGGSGSGSGSGDRNISMNITIHNQFAVGRNSDVDAKSAAEKVVGMLVNKLRDAEFAIG